MTTSVECFKSLVCVLEMLTFFSIDDKDKYEAIITASIPSQENNGLIVTLWPHSGRTVNGLGETSLRGELLIRRMEKLPLTK